MIFVDDIFRFTGILFILLLHK